MRTKTLPPLQATETETQAVRTLESVRDRVGLDGLDSCGAAELSARLASQLAGLDSSQKQIFRRDLACAAHDVEELIETLENELGQLACELQSLTRHSGAALAYGRQSVARTARRP
jgi:hypothetical protein